MSDFSIYEENFSILEKNFFDCNFENDTPELTKKAALTEKTAVAELSEVVERISYGEIIDSPTILLSVEKAILSHRFNSILKGKVN